MTASRVSAPANGRGGERQRAAREAAITQTPPDERGGERQRAAREAGLTQTPPDRVRDAARTRQEILDVATAEFAAHGYHGARVDEIAALTRTTKRMIYYHFGGKKQLYIAVLERAYVRIRSAEREVTIDHLDPVTA